MGGKDSRLPGPVHRSARRVERGDGSAQHGHDAIALPKWGGDVVRVKAVRGQPNDRIVGREERGAALLHVGISKEPLNALRAHPLIDEHKLSGPVFRRGIDQMAEIAEGLGSCDTGWIACGGVVGLARLFGGGCAHHPIVREQHHVWGFL